MNDAEWRTLGAAWRRTPRGQVTDRRDRGTSCCREHVRPTTCWDGLPLPDQPGLACTHLGAMPTMSRRGISVSTLAL